MGASDPVLQAVCAVLVLAVPLALLIVVPPPDRRRILAVVGAGSIGVAASLLVDAALASPVDPPALVLDAALAGAIAASVTVLAALRLGSIGGAVFGAAWSIIVFQPVVTALIGAVPSLVQTVFGAVDYAGVLVTHVAAAASLLMLFVLPAPAAVTVRSPEPAALPRANTATVLLTLGAAAWMIGVERVVNAATGRTLVNAIVGMIVGALVWALIERIAGRPFTPVGLVAGAALAWAAVGSGVAFLSPMALGAAAVIGVASGSAIVVRARVGTDLGRRASVAVMVAAVIGGIVLGLLADGFGLASTGSSSLLLGQLGAMIAIALGAAVLGVLCWLLAVVAITLRGRTAETKKA